MIGFDVMELYLKVPTKEELFYRQEWLKNPKTMSYNAGYDIDIKVYNKKTGIIIKTDDEMLEWYYKWIDNVNEKFFSYVYVEGIEVPIGEVYYYLDDDKYNVGILIDYKFRGSGYSYDALKLLCKKAKQNNIHALYDQFECDRINTLKVFEKVGFNIVDEIEINKFNKKVKCVIVKIEL